VQVWDARTGRISVIYRGHDNGVQALAWSPDGKRIASGSWDTTVQVWNATTGQHLFTYRGHADIVGALAWSPDGERIASVDDQLRVWQAS
jgi:eukaryotic-like serine/threonine-protein kinase